ncbi:hypothetical protein GCM10018952_52990 [Streptosporangium vulgare]
MVDDPFGLAGARRPGGDPPGGRSHALVCSDACEGYFSPAGDLAGAGSVAVAGTGTAVGSGAVADA